METSVIKITFDGEPRTKKNGMRIVCSGNKRYLLPSVAYKEYAKSCNAQIKENTRKAIEEPVNMQCVYYMKTRRRVDLCNLIEATCDILVDAGVIKDDNSTIVVGHDGSRVMYDKERPRVEITITKV